MKSMGVATGCGCKEVHVYRFPHTTYPYSSCICSFCSSIPTFCSFLKMFFVIIIDIIVFLFKLGNRILRPIHTTNLM